MSTPEKHDIFISYRRSDGGVYVAQSFSLELEKRGYSVFFDGKSISSGRFWDKIRTSIEGCTDFLVILTPGALDRCAEGTENDFVAREINLAMRLGKNILPMMMGDFKFPNPMPECIRGLEAYNAGDAVPMGSPQAIEQTLDYRIKKEFFKSVPKNANGNNSRPPASRPQAIDPEKELLKKALVNETKIAENERKLREAEVAAALAKSSARPTITKETVIITERSSRKGLWFTLTALVVVGVIGVSVLNKEAPEDKNPPKPTKIPYSGGNAPKPPSDTPKPDVYTNFAPEVLEFVKNSPEFFGQYQKLKDMEGRSLEIKVDIQAAKNAGNQNAVSKETKLLEEFRAKAKSIKAEIENAYFNGPQAPTAYKIERGDSLSKIAGKLGCTVAALEEANPGINNRNLRIGQTLKIPEKSGIIENHGKKDVDIALIGGPKTRYTVERGDTLSKIADKLKCTPEALKAANPEVDFSRLSVGSEIEIPQSSETNKSTETVISIPSSPAANNTPSPAQHALAEIPTDKYELISAYDKTGLVYLDGNTRELLAFIKALGSQDPALLAAILDTFPKVVNEVYQDKRSGEKRTILAWATKNRADGDLIRRFIEAGADVNAVTSKGETALSYAVSSRNLEAVKALLAAGADSEFKTASGRTMIELARGNQAITALLFDAKKSFTAEDLKNALSERNTDIKQVRKMLDFGLKPDDDLMYLAVCKGDVQILEAFLEAGGNANAQYKSVPIIFYTDYRGNISCAKLLVDYGADTNFTVRISGRTAYRTYLKNRNATELLKYIESAGTRPRKQAKR